MAFETKRHIANHNRLHITYQEIAIAMATLPAVQPMPRLIAATDVIPTIKDIVADYQAVRDAIIRKVTPETACFTNTIQPLIDVQNHNNGRIAIIAMLQYASPDQAARDASEEALKLLSDCESEETTRADLFLLIKAVKEKGEPLDVESQKFVDETFKDYTRCGHGLLSAEQIEDYLRIRNEIDVRRRQFARNIMDDTGGMWFSEADLDGVPEADMKRFTHEEDRGYFISFRYHDLDPVLKFAKNPATRKRLNVANKKKLALNVGIFQDVILRRDSNARLLGYPSHAAFRLERRVAKTTKWVHAFLERLKSVLLPQGKIEMQQLVARKKAYLETSKYRDQDEKPDIMFPWDFGFYSRLAEEELSVDHIAIAEYFPLQHTVASMLEIFTHCLQLRFDKIADEHRAPVIWHDDVEVWSVWNKSVEAGTEFIGYLYMDLLSRENKYRGSQDVNLQGSYVDKHGSRVYPATLLMCSFPRPTETGCALLKHDQVVSLFHELGHGIHDLLARTEYARFHGWQSSPDFAEAPSVMLENWCWLKDELRQMSCHYTSLDEKWRKDWQASHPGQSVPPTQITDELIDPLVQSRSHLRARWLLSQLAISTFDMAVHDLPTHEDCEALDITALHNKINAEICLFPTLKKEDQGHPYVHYGHLLSGYDAGYYGYLSAQVFAADLFEHAFAADPRSQLAWNKYRKAILEPGASRDELQMLYDFLGREPNPDALLRSLSLQK